MNNIYHKAAADGYLKRLKQTPIRQILFLSTTFHFKPIPSPENEKISIMMMLEWEHSDKFLLPCQFYILPVEWTRSSNATKKDLNLPDDDGMTPTLYAAYHGNLDALRLCCSRGGDPDRCDYTGNTALHFAAANGYMHCLMFLVSFGANIWQMDNDFHTPMDVAAIREKNECVQYLDGIRMKQEALDKKKVGKLQEKAKKDAEKHIEKYDKLQQRHQKSLTESHTREYVYDQFSTTLSSKSGSSKKSSSVKKINPSSDQNITFSQATFEKTAKSDLKKKIDKQKNRTASAGSTTYPGSSDFKISERDGKSVRSIAGVPSENYSSVMYVPNESMSTVNGSSNDEKYMSGKRKMIGNLFTPPMPNYQDPTSRNGQATMPHFGSIALRSNLTSANSMYSVLPDNEVPSLPPPKFVPDHKIKRDSDSDLDDFDEDDIDSTSLDTFLASLQLEEYSRPFKAEKMDMDALMLCDHDSLKQMGLPLGDRLKILNAMKERKAKMQSPGDMELTMF